MVVEVGDRFGRHHQPTEVGDRDKASRSRRNGSALAKNSGASKRSSTKPEMRPASGWPLDVVVALQVVDPTSSASWGASSAG